MGLPGGIRASSVRLREYSDSEYCAYLRRFERADERTRTADLTSLRVIYQALQGFAQECKSRIFKGFSLLRLCCELHRIAFPVVSE